jgi:hypothetical protein
MYGDGIREEANAGGEQGVAGVVAARDLQYVGGDGMALVS